MKIEALVRWSSFSVKQQDSTEAYLKRLVDGEESEQDIRAEVVHEYSPLVFDMDDVSRFNKANDPDHTTLRFYDSDVFVVKIPYEQFRDLYSEQTGKVILSVLPVEESEEEQDTSGKDEFEDL